MNTIKPISKVEPLIRVYFETLPVGNPSRELTTRIPMSEYFPGMSPKTTGFVKLSDPLMPEGIGEIVNYFG